MKGMQISERDTEESSASQQTQISITFVMMDVVKLVYETWVNGAVIVHVSSMKLEPRPSLLLWDPWWGQRVNACWPRVWKCGDLCADFVLWLSKLLSHDFSAFHECWYTQHQLSWAKCEEISHILSFYHVPFFVLLLFYCVGGRNILSALLLQGCPACFWLFLHTLPIKKAFTLLDVSPFCFSKSIMNIFFP